MAFQLLVLSPVQATEYSPLTTRSNSAPLTTRLPLARLGRDWLSEKP